MDSEFTVRYVIDRDDNISYVDEGWCRFAEANGGTELLPPAIIGKSLWVHITDPTTAGLYRQIVARVRKGEATSFTLRCDGPECRRVLEMTIAPAPGGSVEFETRPVSSLPREPEALGLPETRRSDRLLRSCSWCNRVDAGFGSNEWVEVEEATKRLGLFENDEMPQLTHGICDTCYAAMRAKISVAA